ATHHRRPGPDGDRDDPAPGVPQRPALAVQRRADDHAPQPDPGEAPAREALGRHDPADHVRAAVRLHLRRRDR
ncbi:MAG: Efflux ABC transporter, permease protein, partial [uncultured Thermomicrobiales bacterium]